MDICDRTLTSTIVALWAGAFFFTATPGRAQANDPRDVDLSLRYVAAQPTSAALTPPVPRECRPRYMAGPGTGVVLGMGSVGVGAPLIWAGTLYDARMTAGASLIVAAGLAAVVASGIKLKRNRDRRAHVCGASSGSFMWSAVSSSSQANNRR